MTDPTPTSPDSGGPASQAGSGEQGDPDNPFAVPDPLANEPVEVPDPAPAPLQRPVQAGPPHNGRHVHPGSTRPAPHSPDPQHATGHRADPADRTGGTAPASAGAASAASLTTPAGVSAPSLAVDPTPPLPNMLDANAATGALAVPAPEYGPGGWLCPEPQRDPQIIAAFRSGRRPLRIWVWMLGLLGGIAAIGTAMYQNTMNGQMAFLFAGVVAALFEEFCKPIGVILMLDRRPHWLTSRVEVIFMCLLGAAVFATLENVWYIYIYIPQAVEQGMTQPPEDWSAFVWWRWVVCTALHLTASLAFAIGLAKAWKRTRTTGRRFDLEMCFYYYIAAVAIHGLYNLAVMILGTVGVLEF